MPVGDEVGNTEEAELSQEKEIKPASQCSEVAGSRLYEQGKELLQKLEAKRMDNPIGCTFKPKVHQQRRRTVSPTKNQTTEMKTEKENRFDSLFDSARKTQEKIEAKRLSSTPNYSFKPKISQKSRRISLGSKKKSQDTKSVFDSLYSNAATIESKRKEKQKELNQKEVEECSFKPKIISTPSKKAVQHHLYDAESIKGKKAELEQKRAEAELAECTFKPQIFSSAKSAGSSKLNGNAKKSFFERLQEAGKKRDERIEELRKKKKEEEMIDLKKSIPKSSSAKKPSDVDSFYVRLYNEGNKRKVTEEREARKREEEAQFSFKPQITKTDSTRKKSSQDIFERLYKEKEKKAEKIEAFEELRLQKEIEACTFKPQIDPQQAPMSNEPIWNRLQKYDKEAILRERELLKEQLELKDCTFKPQVDAAGPPSSHQSNDIFDRLSANAPGVSAKKLSTNLKATASDQSMLRKHKDNARSSKSLPQNSVKDCNINNSDNVFSNGINDLDIKGLELENV